MSTNTLDDLGRRAAADLHARTRSLDTEAALVSFGAPGGGRLRPGRSFGRPGRPVTIAAAIVLVAGLVGSGLLARRSTNDQSAAARPPAVGGPVTATVTTPSGAVLDLHAPSAIHDRDQVQVTVRGAEAGQELTAQQCRTATGAVPFNPMTHCADPGGRRAADGTATVAADGTATASLVVWSRYDGAGQSRVANTCGASGCVLALQLRQPNDGAAQTGSDGRPLLVLPLRFDEDAGGPAEPVFTAEETVAAVSSDFDPGVYGVAMEFHGKGLVPGATTLSLVAYGADRLDPPLQFVNVKATAEVMKLDVPADGTIDNTVAVPLSVANPAGGARLTCGLDGITCDLQVGYPEKRADARFLAPQPIPFTAP